eukprot:7244090-Alexandrium_andersonii.AAC.1
MSKHVQRELLELRCSVDPVVLPELRQTRVLEPCSALAHARAAAIVASLHRLFALAIPSR